MEKEIKFTPDQSDAQPGTPASVTENLAKIVEDSAVEGLNGGILLFMNKRGLAIDDRADTFADLITAEFGSGKTPKTYPLSKSIAFPVREALKQSNDVFCHLYAGGEEENLRKLIRVIVSGEMLTVMQDKLEEVMACYNSLK